jgi:hypothetical protein
VDQNQSPQEKMPQGQPVEQKQVLKTQTPETTESKSGGRSNIALIIIIIVMVLLILGIGVYFAFKYASDKLLSAVSPSTTATIVSTSGTTSTKAVLEKLMYPGSEISDQKQEKNAVYVTELTLISKDSVDTIKSYYLNLIEKNKWTITKQGSDPDYDNYYLTFSDGTFTDELDITKYDLDDHTTILHQLSGENLKVDGLYIPSSGTSTSTATSQNTSTPTTSPDDDYVINDSNTRLVSKSELTGLTPWQLKVARNEIYARYGRPFVHEDMKCYFAKKSWYKSSDSFSESMLSSIENKNVATIKAYEEETDSPLASHDSGCNTND